MIFCLTCGLFISNVLFGTIIKHVEYGDIEYTKYHSTTQRTPEWCYYATMEMLFPNKLQYDFAEDYFDFTHNFSGQIPPCRRNPYACGGVKGVHAIPFWNYCTKETKSYLAAIETIFKINGTATPYPLPCMGIRKFSQSLYAHAIFIFHVATLLEENNGNYVVKYRTTFIDPANGLPATIESRSDGLAPNETYVLK